jgi:hypothetical protein
MALTYFGLCDPSGNPSHSGEDSNSGAGFAYFFNNPTYHTFTCPGSGSMVLKELSVMMRGSSANARCAVFSADRSTLIAQGASAVAISGSIDSWQGHLSQSAITPNPVSLVGGSTYVLVVAIHNTGSSSTMATSHCDTTYNSGNFSGYYDGDYNPVTAGYSTLSTANKGYPYPVRAGVEAPAASALLSRSRQANMGCLGSLSRARSVNMGGM